MERVVCLRLAVLITLVTVCAGIASYFYSMASTEELVREQLVKYIGERGLRESALFLESDAYQARFQKEYIERYKRMGDEDPVEWFEEHLEKRPEDGTYRSKPELYHGKDRELGRRDVSASMMIGADTEITPEVRRALAIGYDMINQYGPAWRKPFDDLYFSSPEKTSVSRWPGTPWGLMMDDKVEWRDEEWFAITTVAKNPERRQRWSGVLFDERNGQWMVSGVTPLDVDGKQVGMVGTDLLLDDIVERTIDETLSGTFNMLLQADGRVIAHPHKVEEIIAEKGMLTASTSADERLRRHYELARTVASFPFVIDNGIDDELVAVTRIKGPEWYFITIYPKALLADRALRSAGFILLSGMASLTAMLLVIWFVLKRSVVYPLGLLTRAVRDFDIPRGQWPERLDGFADTASSLSPRPDEIGLLAGSFVDMGAHLRKTYDEQEASKKDLKEREERYRAVISTSHDGFWTVDMTGRLIEVNDAYVQRSGYSREELLSMRVSDLDALDSATEVAARVKRIRRFGGDLFSSRHRAKSGEIWDVEVSVGHMDIEGSLFFCFFRDITERKRAETTLLESREEFRLIVECSPIPMVLTDGEGNVVAFNRKFIDLFGWTTDDVRTPEEWWQAAYPDPAYRAEVMAAWAAAAAEAKAAGTEIAPQQWHLTCRNGDVREVLFQMVPVSPKHSVIAMIDITESKHAEQQILDAKEAAEFANRSKTEFLANMSHELRTPLTIINGASDILNTELFGPIGDPKYREYAQNIQEAGEYLLRVINDLLNISQIEMGRFELNEEDLDVEEVLSACRNLIVGRAFEAGLELGLEVEKGLPILRADELRIKQILLNLLSNAIKFTPKRGTVTLKGGTEKDGRLVLVVADTGIGFDADNIGKELNNLGQAGDPYTRETQGAGIGLPLSKRLAELHGATLELESEVGVGTTVIVRFPLERLIK